MNKCIDLHLLVPCHLSKTNIHPGKCETDDDGAFFMEKLAECNRNEFSNTYVRNLERHSLGKQNVYVTDADGITDSKSSIAIISIHSETHLAVVDIIIPNITTGAEKIVDFFRSKRLMVGYDSKQYLIEQWLAEKFGLMMVGEHRSLVFSGTPLSDEEKINYLATECEPMGRITGDDFKEMSTHNIAQYDTAEAYVSEVTLLEISNNFKPKLRDRLAEQSIEVFFIKLLMLQDAAICSVNKLIEEAINNVRKNKGNSNDELLILVTELSKSTLFFDPRNFYYPTVRASSIRIADKFGLPRQLKLMTENKSILEQLIEINSIRIQSNENDIINVILIVLAVIQVVPIALGDWETITYAGIVSLSCIAFLVLLKRKIFNKREKRHTFHKRHREA